MSESFEDIGFVPKAQMEAADIDELVQYHAQVFKLETKVRPSSYTIPRMRQAIETFGVDGCKKAIRVLEKLMAGGVVKHNSTIDRIFSSWGMEDGSLNVQEFARHVNDFSRVVEKSNIPKPRSTFNDQDETEDRVLYVGLRRKNPAPFKEGCGLAFYTEEEWGQIIKDEDLRWPLPPEYDEALCRIFVRNSQLRAEVLAKRKKRDP